MAFGFHRDSGKKSAAAQGARAVSTESRAPVGIEGHTDLPELVVVPPPHRGVLGRAREAGSDLLHGRWNELPGDVAATGRAVARAFRGRPASDHYYALRGGGFHRGGGADTPQQLRALQGRDALAVVGSRRGYDNPRTPNLAPDDILGINGHAWVGDGTARDVDFRKVSLADLGPSLNKLAAEDGSRLNQAIKQAAATGSPVPWNGITDLRAGGGILGRTPMAQQFGIGRFSVAGSGVVTADNDFWNLDATLSGKHEKQDYPYDKTRGPIGTAFTDLGLGLQHLLGGEDYEANFLGSQHIKTTGKR
jgi:hypothetical protein